MEKLKFRKLRADEIELRVGTVTQPYGENKGGVSLLLYKNSRVDMNVLDEKVGPMNWQREHRELKGNIYCGVSIRDENNEWVTKWDAGSESFTEKEKGEASDSFKRSCVNWGIGRELYTGPFIWINGGKIEWKEYKGKKQPKDSFYVEKISYVGDVIDGLSIKNNRGERVFLQKPKGE